MPFLDANTIWDFREALERDERKGSERLFARFGEMLETRGLIGHEGSIVECVLAASRASFAIGRTEPENTIN